MLGREIVTMIDASLARALKSDSATLASWRQAKRATKKGVVSRGASGGALSRVIGKSLAPASDSLGASVSPVVSARVPASVSVVPAVSSHVSAASGAELPEVGVVQVGASQEFKAA